MHMLTFSDVESIVTIMCDTANENKEKLSQLDANIGDGDFGESLSSGFNHVRVLLKERKGINSIEQLLEACGNTIINNCGGCTGPIWGGAFRAAAKSAKGKGQLCLDDLVSIMKSIVDSIQSLGGARLGDKTLLDALIPAYLSLSSVPDKKSASLLNAFKEAAKSARTGAESTTNIIAKCGRARSLGKRSIGYPDPGAIAVADMLQNISEGLCKTGMAE